MFGPAARSPRSPELFSCDIGIVIQCDSTTAVNKILRWLHYHPLILSYLRRTSRRWSALSRAGGPFPRLSRPPTRLSIYARNGLADPPATARPPRIGRSTHAARLSHATLWRKTHRQHGDTNTHSNVSTPTQHSLTLTPLITRSQTAPAERGSAPATPWLPSSAASLRAPPSKMLRRRQRVRCLCRVRPGASSPHQAPG